jgi:hypothetical protein
MTNSIHSGGSLRLSLGLVLTLVAPAATRAQDRPFLFSVTMATDAATPALRLDYDVGAGERAFQSNIENQPEQRIAIQASLGRFTAIGRVGLVSAGSAYQSSQSGELVVSLVAPSPRFALAAGGGVLHEAGGTNVLFTATGGPAFHPSDTGRFTDAQRDLPATRQRVGYALRAGLTYRLF